MIASKKYFFVFLGLVAVLLAAGAGMFYTYNNQLVELNEEVAILKADEELLDLTLGEFENRKKQIEQLTFVDELASSALPPTREQGVVVGEIKKFILDAGLNFETVSFNGAAASGALSQTEIPLGLEGVRVLPVEAVVAPGASYEQVIRLLENIENNRRRMQVTSFSLTPEPENENRFSTFTINIDVYIRSATASSTVPTNTDGTTPQEGDSI